MSELKEGMRPPKRSKKWEEDLRKQLASYFVDKKGYQVYSPNKSYILKDRSDWHKNIILDRVAQYFDIEIGKRHFALHKWIHHGLSSQAFLFNLFGPLVVDKQWNIFDEILYQAGIQLSTSIQSGEFELEDPKIFNEVKGQPTSIDFCLYTKDEEKVFLEFKFTEKNFGDCSVFGDGDCDGKNPADNFKLCYLHEVEERSYWPLMKRHGLLTEQIENAFQCPFATLYQLYRLILFALEKKGQFLLLYDERNPSFLVERDNIKRGLFNLVYESLPSKVQDRCHALSVQSIFPILQKYPELTWMDELKEKYFGETS